MKAFLKKFFDILEKTGKILMGIAILGWIMLAGSFLLNLFGLISYDPPINPEAGMILRVELVDSKNLHQMEILAELTGTEMEAFLNEFEQVTFKRYANDPPEPYGDIMIAVYYEDGARDCIGEDMNQRFNSSGIPVSVKGWFYCPGNEMKELFEKYAFQP